MRFAHIADCHVGAWRDSKMKELNFLQFKLSINKIIEENSKSKISFVIIAGDLFNTSVPSIEALKLVTENLKKLKDVGIKVGTKIGEQAIKNMSRKIIVDINQKVGFRLVTKFGEKGVINLGKAIPILGGLIGGTIDAASTHSIGKISKKVFV